MARQAVNTRSISGLLCESPLFGLQAPAKTTKEPASFKPGWRGAPCAPSQSYPPFAASKYPSSGCWRCACAGCASSKRRSRERGLRCRRRAAGAATSARRDIQVCRLRCARVPRSVLSGMQARMRARVGPGRTELTSIQMMSLALRAKRASSLRRRARSSASCARRGPFPARSER
jgi:hypothetical protein